MKRRHRYSQLRSRRVDRMVLATEAKSTRLISDTVHTVGEVEVLIVLAYLDQELIEKKGMPQDQRHL